MKSKNSPNEELALRLGVSFVLALLPHQIIAGLTPSFNIFERLASFVVIFTVVWVLIELRGWQLRRNSRTDSEVVALQREVAELKTQLANRVQDEAKQRKN